MPLAWRDGGIRAYQNHHSQVPVAIASRESITANCHLTVEFLSFCRRNWLPLINRKQQQPNNSKAPLVKKPSEKNIRVSVESVLRACERLFITFDVSPLRRHRRSTPRSWPSSISSQVAAPPPWCRRHNSPPALRISRAAPGTLSRMRRPGWSCRRPWSPSRSRTWLPTDRPHLPRTPRRARPIWWVSKPVGDL